MNRTTARALAAVMFDNSKPTKGEIEKARCQLDGLTADGKLRCIAGATGGSTGGAATRWVAP